MKDQRIDHEGGGGVIRTLRLALLMAVGASLGLSLFTGPGHIRDMARKELVGALVGAFAGIAIEASLRSGKPAQNTFWRFGVRDLMAAIAVAAVGLCVITAILKM